MHTRRLRCRRSQNRCQSCRCRPCRCYPRRCPAAEKRAASNGIKRWTEAQSEPDVHATVHAFGACRSNHGIVHACMVSQARLEATAPRHMWSSRYRRELEISYEVQAACAAACLSQALHRVLVCARRKLPYPGLPSGAGVSNSAALPLHQAQRLHCRSCLHTWRP